LRGRRGTCHWAGSGGVLGARWSFGAVRHFAWQAWHLVLRGAGVALGDMHLRFAWQACTDGWAGSGGAAWGPLVARGHGTGPGLVVGCLGAGVALGDVHLHFAWQV